MTDDLISRQAAIDAILHNQELYSNNFGDDPIDKYTVAIIDNDAQTIAQLPSTQPPKEIPKRVLWTGWKGCRDTRYKCPNCEKPVRNDDAYCHRCGQRLMFPHISFTDYVPGQKQDVIVRWDNEG